MGTSDFTKGPRWSVSRKNFRSWILLGVLLSVLLLFGYMNGLGSWAAVEGISSSEQDALVTVGAPYTASQIALVELGYAKYQGRVNEETRNYEFLGIRYAAAPTGALRWREPQLPEPAAGVQSADTQPNTCWQASMGILPTSPFPSRGRSRRQDSGSSEDCLFLNVYTPALREGKLPVVVWIHGGGYFSGGASSYDGNDLLYQAGGNVVVVIIQYRLGIFGFLSGQKVRDGGTLNAGLYDQQFALQWVQQHISKFGGDPTKVTIWGQSAGAGSVIQHVVANDGNTQPPLFRAAITSSSYLPSQYAFNDRIPEAIFKDVVDQSGCSSAQDELACLRDADVDVLNKVAHNITQNQFFGTCIFVPVVDGNLIKRRPTEQLRERELNGEAVLSVTNSFEGTMFVNSRSADTITTQDYMANLFPELTTEHIAAGAAQYAGLGAPINQARAVMSEAIFICPTYFLLRAFKNKCFKGQFAVPPALHGNDVLYYFPHGNVQVSAPWNNTEFTNNFSQSFMNFVLATDPNVKWDSSNTLPGWPQWKEDRGTEMLFNKTEEGAPVFQAVQTDEGLMRRCKFWESVSAFTAQ